MENLRTLTYRIALSLTKSNTEAEDLCHDVLCCYLKQTEEISNKTGWLYTTTLHKQQEIQRHKKMAHKKERQIQQYLYSTIHIEEEEKLYTQQKLKIISDHIRKLPLLEKKLFYEVIEGSKSQEVIANTLNITLPSLKNKLYRIRKGIRSVLNENGF